MPDIASLVQLLRDPATTLGERQNLYAEIVRAFQDMAYGYAFALLGDPQAAQDAAQEALIAAYLHLDQLRDPAAFPGWLKRILHTQCQRQLRGRQTAALSIDNLTAAIDDAPYAEAERGELRSALRQAVQSLPEHERQAVVLCYVDGYSQQEVAGFLDVQPPTLRKRLQRGRARMRETMMDWLHDSLAEDRPSQDERFLHAVQLATTLDEAALDAQFSVLEAALVDGLDVNAPGESGQTLLHWAVRRRHREAAALLLRYGADPLLADRSGRTPLSLAQDLRLGDLVELMQREIAKR